MRVCLTCANLIPNRFYHCLKCANDYDMLKENGKYKKPTDWDDWNRELFNDEVRLRRRETKERKYEIFSYEELEENGIEFSEEDVRISMIENGEYDKSIDTSIGYSFDKVYHISKEDYEQLIYRIQLLDDEEIEAEF